MMCLKFVSPMDNWKSRMEKRGIRILCGILGNMQYLKRMQESSHWENKLRMKRRRRWSVGQTVTWWREFQAEGVSKCKGSKTGMCLKYLRNSKEASTGGTDWANWRLDEIRQREREREGSVKCSPCKVI